MIQAGDVILFRVVESSKWFDQLIGWGQKVIHQAPTDAMYCHAALVGPDPGRMFEARWPKIHNVPIDWGAMTKRNVVEVYRLKNVEPDQMAKIMDSARLRLGQWYDLLAIFSFGIIQFGPAAVCSQYVWECFTAGSVVLCPFESLESPDDLAASTLLERVA